MNQVVGGLKEKFGYEPIIMVGDGATDMEARPPATAFVGFGGVIVREAVKKGSDWYVMDVQEMIDEL